VSHVALRSIVVAGMLVSGLAVSGACRETLALSPTPQPNPLPTGPLKRLLVVTHTTGFRHSSIETAEAVLTRLASDSGAFSVAFCRTGDDVSRMLTQAGLAEFDGVFFANTTGDLGVPDLQAFLTWVRDGHAFLGAHSASDTYHSSPEFISMLGAEFETHGNETTVDIRIDDRTHPATSALPAPWRLHDEIYEFRSNPRPRVTVLLSLDRHPADGHPDAGQPGDFPLAWYQAYGSGRVFYTALGHREDVWNNTQFQQHVLGALRWALQF
jgi:type 1 glutamine amidotransferase